MPEDLDSILGTSPQPSLVSSSPSYSRTASIGEDVSGASNQVAAVMKRYKDAYIVARVTSGFGKTIKTIGVIIGVLLVLIGFLIANKNGPQNPISYVGITGIFIGIFGGALFYIIGVLVSSQGQILKASLDGAVNSSPFLANEHKAKIMSLPEA
jgi:hypothetical protein